MTEKLFYRDSHLSEFEAEVISCRPLTVEKQKKGISSVSEGSGQDVFEVELDRTAFFPEGGGFLLSFRTH